MEEKEELTEKISCEVDKLMDELLQNPLEQNDVDLLGKLVDISTDLANQKHWNKEEEVIDMRYSEGSYGEEYGRRGVKGTGRGRYRGGRGSGRYRGDERMEEMQEQYENYNEGRQRYDRGSYRGEDEMIEATEGIMKNIYEIVEDLAESDNPEVMKIITKHAKKMSKLGEM